MKGPLVITDEVCIPAADLTYEYSRAGGPGGQHVNTTDSRVRLRFHLSRTTALSPAVKQRLRQARPAWCTDDGDIAITSDRMRSQHRNVEECRERLAEAIVMALVPPTQRRPTRPSGGAKRRRLEAKKQRGKLKSTRKKVDRDGD